MVQDLKDTQRDIQIEMEFCNCDASDICNHLDDSRYILNFCKLDNMVTTSK